MTCVFEENIRSEIAGHIHDPEDNVIANFKVQEKPGNFLIKITNFFLLRLRQVP